MKRATTFFGVAVAALVAQGVIATQLPPPWCPDLALLALIGLGLRWEKLSTGLPLAALVGYATDLLSGSLLGQHALLDMLAFAGTLAATRRLNLRGAWPLALFSAALAFGYGLAMLAITGFFVGGVEVRVGWASSQTIHSLVVGAFAPLVSSVVGRVFARLDEQESGHRPVAVGGAR